MSCCGGKCYQDEEQEKSYGTLRYYKTIGLKLSVSNRLGRIRSVFLFGAGTHWGIGLRPEDQYYSVIEYGPQKGGLEVISITDQSSYVIIESVGVPYVYLVDYFLENSLTVNHVDIECVVPGKEINKTYAESMASNFYLKIWELKVFQKLFKPAVDVPIYIFDYVRLNEPNSLYLSTSGTYFTIERGVLLELGLPALEENYVINVSFNTNSF